MASDYFDFKQFRVYHHQCAMKVGTDGVLLGALAQVPPQSKNILDIGTGSGLIALMLAQRTSHYFTDCRITALEIDEAAVAQAANNVANSRWQHRIDVIQGDLQHFQGVPHSYHCIVSNPPYFNRALHSPDTARNRARHADNTLSPDMLLTRSALYLHPKGVISFIIPSEYLKIFQHKAEKLSLYPQGYIYIYTKKNTAPKRVILFFTFQMPSNPPTQQHLIIHNETLAYSEEFVTLLKDFYLHF